MFQNREQAAMLLAVKLEGFLKENVLVLAIPRGAVVMGKVIADRLRAPLDVLVMRKIGTPNNPELAIGAVGPQGVIYWDNRLCRAVGVDKASKKLLARSKEQERKERERLLRGRKRYPTIAGETILVVDDGVATGATSIVAGKFLRKKKAKKSILVTPVIAKDTLPRVQRYFDEVVYLETPKEFYAVGQFYEEFPQVSDDEVVRILKSK